MEILYMFVGIALFAAIAGLGRLVLGALGWDYFEPWDVLICFLVGALTCVLLFIGEVVGKALCS